MSSPGEAEKFPLGEIPGVTVGMIFVDRGALAAAGVHRERQAGITGTAARGAESIVLSGGYADIDEGETIVYTGHGGQNAGKQVENQNFLDRGNAALKTSMIKMTPVRVIRGRGKTKARNAHIHNPPPSGYRYDGLYFVDDCYYEEVKGLRLCRFRLSKASQVDVIATPLNTLLESEEWHSDLPAGNKNPGKRAFEGSRVVRSVQLANEVKALHDHTCQACGNRLEVSGRGYAEGAHIRALSGGHDGPDEPDNMLCLCPNCHVLFDYGALIVEKDYSVFRNGQLIGKLRTNPKHPIRDEHLEYHRQRYADQVS
ncbi:YDG/SRA domain-containing protein [Amycolatopsis sp. MtRt-6]|uniref:YDG/SRA domain-containing protein n=1 Tax=Amycolatopsis sp. MtRt-6 TaxID=2792782 RepID=UPI001A8D3380|nr:YDG/SRA domain-containing protein [Amycolatopsis sp. MtRt-6]